MAYRILIVLVLLMWLLLFYFDHLRVIYHIKCKRGDVTVQLAEKNGSWYVICDKYIVYCHRFRGASRFYCFCRRFAKKLRSQYESI